MHNPELNALKNELLEVIKNLPEVIEYCEIKEQVAQHREIKQYTNHIKKLQKELVNAQAVRKDGQVELLQKNINAIKAQLEDNLLYQNFMQCTVEVEQVLFEISDLIESFILK